MQCIIEKDISQAAADRAVAIIRSYTPQYFTENFPGDMAVDMRFQRIIYLQERGEMVSCIVFTCLDASAHITLMVTRRDRAHQGCGHLLMQRFTDHVSQLGLNSIELYTFSPKTRPVYQSTVAFYQSTGFQIVKEIPNLWEDGTVTLKMRKSW